MYLDMGENMVANGEYEKISTGRVLVSVSTPHKMHTWPAKVENVLMKIETREEGQLCSSLSMDLILCIKKILFRNVTHKQSEASGPSDRMKMTFFVLYSATSGPET